MCRGFKPYCVYLLGSSCSLVVTFYRYQDERRCILLFQIGKKTDLNSINKSRRNKLIPFFFLESICWISINNPRLSSFFTICLLVCVHTQSRPILCDPWTFAHQAPLSMEFSRQEYWNGLMFSTPRDLPDPRIEPAFLSSPSLSGTLFSIVPSGKPFYLNFQLRIHKNYISLFILKSKNVNACLLFAQLCTTHFEISLILTSLCLWFLLPFYRNKSFKIKLISDGFKST